MEHEWVKMVLILVGQPHLRAQSTCHGRSCAIVHHQCCLIDGTDTKEADFRGVTYLKGVHGLGLHVVIEYLSMAM